MSEIDVSEIFKYLPHRYPFLLVDRVLEIELGKSIVALKNVTYNEPFFPGHFPGKPVMPGVLIIEALAQTTGILSMKTMDATPDDGSIYLLVGIDNVRFKRQVKPGDQLILNVKFKRKVRSVWKFEAEATVDNEIVTKTELMCAEKAMDS